MCNPALAMLAISAASSAVSYANQSSAAKAQTKAVEDGYRQEMFNTARQYEQQNQVAMEDMSQRHREYLIEEGRLRTIGAESGLYGATQDRIEAEARNNASEDIATLEANRLRGSEQVSAQANAKRFQANSQYANIRQPSAVATGLQIASAYHSYKNPPGNQ